MGRVVLPSLWTETGLGVKRKMNIKERNDLSEDDRRRGEIWDLMEEAEKKASYTEGKSEDEGTKDENR